MYRQGLRPGDRVAYIGFDSSAAHVGVEQAHIIALVPQRATHDNSFPGRPDVLTLPESDKFWRSNPQTKERVFGAFRSVGAKWVFADPVPKGLDTHGWQIAGRSNAFRESDYPYT